jgi:aminopeptidase N
MSRFLSLLLALAAPVAAQSPIDRADPRLAPGVSAALARQRAATLADLRYDVALSLPAARTAPVAGTTTLRFVRRGTGPVIIDFDASASQVQGVTANGRDLGVLAPVQGHLVIPASALRAGENAVTIRFVAGDVPLNRDDEFLYTVFVPARARQAMPVFDQPDLKARWTLTLDLPAAWAAVANGAETSRTVHGDRATVRFAETKPLATYLMAFAAGRFEVDSAVRDGRTFRMFHRERDASKVARNRDAIVDLHAQALRFMEQYTGIPYPWGKFDILLAPAFQFGGMEHAGAIAYNASGLMLDANATQGQLLGRASVIAHETAHLWFGDLVTMRWFDDVWLKEVFANFFAAKIVEPSFPTVNHPLRFLFAHYPAAYDVDRTAGANAIRQPLDNLAEAGSLYGAIIYQKAPIVMRQLELLMGEPAFREGMRRYLRRYAYGNATWPELVAILDALTPADLSAWSRAWVGAPGRPSIAATLDRTAPVRGGGHRVTLVSRDERGAAVVRPQAVRVAVGDACGVSVRAAQLAATPVTVTVPASPPCAGGRGTPWVLPTGDGLAYGDVVLDAASRAALLSTLPRLADPLLRGSALVTLWEELQGGRVAPDALQSTLHALLEVEADELIVARALGQLESLRGRWLDTAIRTATAARHEAVVRAGLARAATPSARTSWFRTLMRTARTDSTLAFLVRVQRGDEAIPGLVLGEDDRTALALQLAVREVPGAEALLDAQLGRITNTDRRARFVFVRPAVSADSAVRRAWFEALRDPTTRRREPWILEGMAWLHHPERAAASASLVPPALALLEELQRTGDIFLPKRWLDATLGGHRSPAVAAMVNAYLDASPALAPRLRAIVRQSADELWRVSGVPGR